jgi:hypothetical protein
MGSLEHRISTKRNRLLRGGGVELNNVMVGRRVKPRARKSYALSTLCRRASLCSCFKGLGARAGLALNACG